MIKIKQIVVDEIILHAKKDFPIEACGYLAGNNGVITKCYEMENIDNSEEHFSFNSAEQFAILKKTRQEELEILGNYHSHPKSPSRPSVEDIKLAYDANILYFIISLADETPILKAFKIVNSKVDKEQIIII